MVSSARNTASVILGELGQIVGNLEPRRLVAHEHMAVWTYTGVGIEGAKGKRVNLRLFSESGMNAGPTGRAEHLELPRRRLVGFKQFFAFDSSPVTGLHLSTGSKSGRMELAAHRAVAVVNVGKRACYFVLDAAAQAAT